jgi:hypothetical protein
MKRQEMITKLCQRYKDDNGLHYDSAFMEEYVDEVHDMTDAELKEEYDYVFGED